jgi:hypothetical protein
MAAFDPSVAAKKKGPARMGLALFDGKASKN